MGRKLYLVVDNTEKTLLWECLSCGLSGTLTYNVDKGASEALKVIKTYHFAKHPACTVSLRFYEGVLEDDRNNNNKNL